MSWNDEEKSQRLKVLRIIQLDSAILDQEILQLLETQLTKVFKYFQRETFRWQPEINLLLRAIVWKFTLFKHSSTIGQSLFDVKYALKSIDGYHGLTWKENIVLGLVFVGSDWVHERIFDFLAYFDRNSATIDKVRTFIKWVEKLWHFASVVNFLIFLQKGIYPSLIERLLQLRHIYIKPQSLKKVSFKFMNREILWHGYAEFIFFILPLINVYKLKNVFRRVMGFTSEGSSVTRSNAVLDLSKTCPICKENPTQPFMAKCGHLYCYYCIKASSLQDTTLICPMCNIAIDHEVSPYVQQL